MEISISEKEKGRPYSNQHKLDEKNYLTFKFHRGSGVIFSHVEFGQGLGKKREERRKRGSTLAPTPSNSCRSTSTCLSSEQAVEEASLWWRVRPVHVQVWAQRPVCLVDVDFFKALHLNHLQRTRGRVI